MKKKMTAFDEPVYDGDWVMNYQTCTYWSPTDILERYTQWNEKEPYYEDGYDMTFSQKNPKMY